MNLICNKAKLTTAVVADMKKTNDHAEPNDYTELNDYTEPTKVEC